MKLKEFLEFKFGSSDVEEIVHDPAFRDIKWDTASVVKMIIGSYGAGVENTMKELNFQKVKNEEAL